jgi:hypothetical protein
MKKFLKSNASLLTTICFISPGSYLLFGRIGFGIWLIFLGLAQIFPKGAPRKKK